MCLMWDVGEGEKLVRGQECLLMFTGPVGPVEPCFYWPEAIFGSLLESSPWHVKMNSYILSYLCTENVAVFCGEYSSCFLNHLERDPSMDIPTDISIIWLHQPTEKQNSMCRLRCELHLSQGKAGIAFYVAFKG